MTATAAATAWYVYGIVPAGSTAGGRGVGGAGVELVRRGGLAAVVSEVPLDEFEESALRERLNDRSWLEANARAHEDVLVSFLSFGVVPLRFGTIYRGREEVERLLDEQADELARMLAHVSGRVELGVKAWVDRARLLRARDVGAPASGRSYLEQRLRARELASAAGEQLAEVVRDAHATLLRVSVDGVLNRPQSRELSGRHEEMILNGAYLVDADDASVALTVGRLRDAYGDLGVAFELTGPWPPHNFVGPEPRRLDGEAS